MTAPSSVNRLDPDAMIVPAEGGRLAFVSPLLSLRHDSAYTVTIVGAVDVLDRALVARAGHVRDGRRAAEREQRIG